jgi:hypothetical protein
VRERHGIAEKDGRTPKLPVSLRVQILFRETAYRDRDLQVTPTPALKTLSNRLSWVPGHPEGPSLAMKNAERLRPRDEKATRRIHNAW